MDTSEVYGVYLNKSALKGSDRLSKCATLSIGIVRIMETGQIRNPSDHPFTDAQFYVQWNGEDDATRPEHTYAWSLNYANVYSVDLDKAERMVKFLRKVEKAESKTPIRPTTFGQYVTLMASALGITKLVKPSSANAGWDYDSGNDSVYPVSDAQYAIDSMIADARKVESPVVS